MPTLTFTYDLNVSIQSGDTIYYASLASGQGGSNHPNAGSTDTKPKILGIVTSVDHNARTVDHDGSVNVIGKYLMFSKNKIANYSGIIGYYAETEYRNYSTLPAEIFATAVDYVESSK